MPAGSPTTRAAMEYGDFQTPAQLASAVARIVARLGIRPRSILEPTCGTGAFVAAAAAHFPHAETIHGFDINERHLTQASEHARSTHPRVELNRGDFFKVDWSSLVTPSKGPWLILGNPPWVTSSELGAIAGSNLPEKSNFQERRGIDAITGKSNFDISEWMLLRYIDWLERCAGTIAVLCKTAVARKVLFHAWKRKIPLACARIHRINAFDHFGAAVDACLLILDIKPGADSSTCDVFENLDDDDPSHRLGFVAGHIVTDMEAFNAHRALLGPEDFYQWRSGIKHDCSKIMELTLAPSGYRNGLGEAVSIEDAYLYPLLKSSDIGNGRTRCRGAMLVTQTYVGEDTAAIRDRAPGTWEYLQRHAVLLDRRASTIYKKKPRFSIFGVGPYTFAPWKVAISGFYKRLRFVKIGPDNGRPVVFDDTVNFLPCFTRQEACFVEALLHADAAQAFFRSMIHWDEKRPITIDLLKRLSMRKLAATLKQEEEYLRLTGRREQLPLLANE